MCLKHAVRQRPGMAIEETMVQVVARASLDCLVGEAVADLNPDLLVLEAARTARTMAGRHKSTLFYLW